MLLSKSDGFWGQKAKATVTINRFQLRTMIGNYYNAGVMISYPSDLCISDYVECGNKETNIKAC